MPDIELLYSQDQETDGKSPREVLVPLPHDKRYHIFLYSDNSADLTAANEVVDKIERHGYKMVLPERDWKDGLSIFSLMWEFINQSCLTIVLISPETQLGGSYSYTKHILQLALHQTIETGGDNSVVVVKHGGEVKKEGILKHVPMIDAQDNNLIEQLEQHMMGTRGEETMLMIKNYKQYTKPSLTKTVKNWFSSPNNTNVLAVPNDDDSIDKHEFDAFMVAASKDTHMAIPLLRDIEEKGCNLAYHDRDFHPGRNTIDCIIQCVENSKAMIIVLTEAFERSAWCKYEAKMGIHRIIETRGAYKMMVIVDGAINVPEYLRWLPRFNSNDPKLAVKVGRCIAERDVPKQQMPSLKGKIKSWFKSDGSQANQPSPTKFLMNQGTQTEEAPVDTAEIAEKVLKSSDAVHESDMPNNTVGSNEAEPIKSIESDLPNNAVQSNEAKPIDENGSASNVKDENIPVTSGEAGEALLDDEEGKLNEASNAITYYIQDCDKVHIGDVINYVYFTDEEKRQMKADLIADIRKEFGDQIVRPSTMRKQHQLGAGVGILEDVDDSTDEEK